LKSTAHENKEVMDALQEGMKDNMDTIKNNIAMLKAKIGIKS